MKQTLRRLWRVKRSEFSVEQHSHGSRWATYVYKVRSRDGTSHFRWR